MKLGNLIARAFVAAALSAFPPLPAFAGKAIDFQFTDILGKNLRLSDYRGKWVLVNFWAPWCPTCWNEVPLLNELNRRKDFVVIGVSLDYGPDRNVVRDTAKLHDFDAAAIVAGGARRDADSAFRQVGPVDFYPTSYLYDPAGEIVMLFPGMVNRESLLGFMENWNHERARSQKVVAGRP